MLNINSEGSSKAEKTTYFAVTKQARYCKGKIITLEA